MRVLCELQVNFPSGRWRFRRSRLEKIRPNKEGPRRPSVKAAAITRPLQDQSGIHLKEHPRRGRHNKDHKNDVRQRLLMGWHQANGVIKQEKRRPASQHDPRHGHPQAVSPNPARGHYLNLATLLTAPRLDQHRLQRLHKRNPLLREQEEELPEIETHQGGQLAGVESCRKGCAQEDWEETQLELC